jgi:hypothetical protein
VESLNSSYSISYSLSQLCNIGILVIYSYMPQD